MADHSVNALTPLVERARKVIQHEQRTNHQDQVVKPGGLESFVMRWTQDVLNICRDQGLDLAPAQRFEDLFQGYRQHDPLQRANSVRAALAILKDLEQAPVSTTSTRTNNTPAQNGAARSSTPVKNLNRPDPPRPIIHQEPKEPPPAPATAKPVSPKPPQPTIRLDAGMSRGHTSLTLLNAEITAIPGVGPGAAAKLRSLGIVTIQNLLYYFPREHRDYSALTPIADIPFNELTTTMGLIWEVETSRTGKGRMRTIATISDESGKLRVSWFNQAYLQKQLNAAKGAYLVVTGIKQRFGNKIEFSVRSHELPEQGELLNTGRLVPIYGLTEGLHAKAMRRFTKWAVDSYAHLIPDHLPPSVIEQNHLVPLSEAIRQIHYPENQELLVEARRRLAFDELFLMQLGMQERRSRWRHESPKGNAFSIDPTRIFVETPPAWKLPTKVAKKLQTSGSTLWAGIAPETPFEGSLPFRFTPAQSRVICEIFGDLSADQPMNRLLQGDVGSGKTAVAAASLYAAAISGYQGAIMAPTEILAEQHARGIRAMLEPFGISTVLLTGSQKVSERRTALAALESGQAMVAIGTHALIQEDVRFQSLGLVVIDEQHRFGVEQRDTLRKKGYHPHMLVMTATPIPRTLALTLYGDLDVSIIDQLPPGRQKIISRWRTGKRRDEAYKLIRAEIQDGRQAFIICPLVEESESLSAKAVTVEYERLSKEVFADLRIGLLHGAMKGHDKDETMHYFRDHKMDILVATSVIEVGIDVPNATVIVIEDADRFGLSQLHQFRGRVGRGKYQSYCYVLSADASIQSQERLEIFQETDDGFKLAEQDLRLRGPGDFFGVRQSGMPEFKIADLTDTGLIEKARNEAARIWEADPYLRKLEHQSLKERVYTFWSAFIAN